MSKYFDKNIPLSPQQADDCLREVIAETREAIFSALQCNYAKTSCNPEHFPDLDTATLNGYCGFAQSFMVYAISDSMPHLSTHPFAVHALKKNAFGHVALAVGVSTTEGEKIFLLDPTFKQFCQGQSASPGEILANMPDGDYMVNGLLNNGFIELNPERAAHYLSAFCNGRKPFDQDTQALAFFKAPPKNPNNCWFSRAQLTAEGYLP